MLTQAQFEQLSKEILNSKNTRQRLVEIIKTQYTNNNIAVQTYTGGREVNKYLNPTRPPDVTSPSTERERKLGFKVMTPVESEKSDDSKKKRM